MTRESSVFIKGSVEVPTMLLALIGIVLVGVGIWGLFAGKIVAGSKGLQPNFYFRKDNPFLYYSFIFVYLAVGFFIVISVF